jgi:hypothetical protein
MKSFSTRKNALPDYIAAIVIFLFVYTALVKFIDPASFQESLGKSPLLKSYAVFLSLAIPIAETGTALLLLFPATRLLGLYASLLLLIAFTVYVGYMIAFIPSLPCSCGGIIEQLDWRQHLILNISITALTCIAIILKRRRWAEKRVPGTGKPVH